MAFFGQALGAVTEAHAAEDAAAVAAVEQLRRRAGGDAPVVSLDARSLTRACALHNRDLFHNVLGLHAEQRRDLRRDCIRAGNAEICLRARLQQGLCIAVAAGVAARAAFAPGRQARISVKRVSSLTAMTLDATARPTAQMRPITVTARIGIRISIIAAPSLAEQPVDDAGQAEK